MSADPRTLPIRCSLAAAGALTATLTLAACGGSSGASNGGPTNAPTSSTAAGSPPGGTRGPAAAGQVAAVSGTTMQVQSQQNGQVAVTWTGSTKFTHQVAVAVSSVKVGSCITAIGATGTSATATSFAAATLIVSSAVNGSCDGGFGGGTRPGGGFPSGARPSGFPTGALPSGFPSGARPSGRAQAGAIASGKVTAVAGSTLTVAARQLGSSSTTSRTVTVGPSTKVTTQAATTAKSLEVGQCVTAEGKADTSGTVTATRVQITSPTGGQCTVGFGRVGTGG